MIEHTGRQVVVLPQPQRGVSRATLQLGALLYTRCFAIVLIVNRIVLCVIHSACDIISCMLNSPSHSNLVVSLFP